MLNKLPGGNAFRIRRDPKYMSKKEIDAEENFRKLYPEKVKVIFKVIEFVNPAKTQYSLQNKIQDWCEGWSFVVLLSKRKRNLRREVQEAITIINYEGQVYYMLKDANIIFQMSKSILMSVLDIPQILGN